MDSFRDWQEYRVLVWHMGEEEEPACKQWENSNFYYQYGILKIWTDCFSTGRLRRAHMGIFTRGSSGDSLSTRVVVKQWRDESARQHTTAKFKKDRSSYLADFEQSSSARHLANKFNNQKLGTTGIAKFARTSRRPHIEYLKVQLVEILEDGHDDKWWWMEPPVDDALFTRYSTNMGDWTKQQDLQDDLPCLKSFSKFTYDVTDKMFMVTDLQGVKTFDPDGTPRFVLTDPVVLCSVNGIFPLTNMEWCKNTRTEIMLKIWNDIQKPSMQSPEQSPTDEALPETEVQFSTALCGTVFHTPVG